MQKDSPFVQLLTEAILHLKDCAGGRNCPECVKSAIALAKPLADSTEASEAIEKAAGSMLAGIHRVQPNLAPPTVL